MIAAIRTNSSFSRFSTVMMLWLWVPTRTVAHLGAKLSSCSVPVRLRSATRHVPGPPLCPFFTLCLPLIRPIGSRRSPEVFVMEPTHAGHLHHPALARRLHTPWLGCVLSQR